MSILWFGQSISGLQFVGILLTFIGLWMYQQAKSDVDKGETKLAEKSMHLLPTQQHNHDRQQSPLVWPANDIKNL
jgi:solute carrier family 35 protein E1